MKLRNAFSLVLLSTTLSAVAQQQSVSPYSLFGPGWSLPQGNAYQQFLGGASAAERNPWYINPDQPAALSALKYTTLDFGSQWSVSRQADAEHATQNRSGGFNAFGLAVPLPKRMAIAGSLRPYTVVGYDMQQSGSNADFGSYVQRYSGRGGLNAATATWSWSPLKYVSVGASARYVFGSADRSTKVYFTDTRFDYSGKVERVMLSDWRWNTGAQLVLPFGLNEFTAGVQWEPTATLNATRDYAWYSFRTNTEGMELPLDTASSVRNAAGTVTLGARQAVGLRWATNRKNALLPAWSIGLHWDQTQVTEYRDFNQNTSGFYVRPAQTWIAHVGIVPALAVTSRKLTSYFSQVQYVGSFRSDRTGLEINGVAVNGWSGNIGMAMPVGGRSFIPGDVKVSTLHLGLNFGSIGSVGQGLVREQYLRATVGLTLNDQWFMKAKFR